MLIAARHFHIIGQVLEDQALVKCPEGCRQFSEIIRRSDDQSVCFPDRIQYRRKAVPADAVSFELLLLASEAGDTSGVLLQAEQVIALDDGACAFRTLCGFREQGIGVPSFAGACVDDNDFISRV